MTEYLLCRVRYARCLVLVTKPSIFDALGSDMQQVDHATRSVDPHKHIRLVYGVMIGTNSHYADSALSKEATSQR